jgi:hypothetical protein
MARSGKDPRFDTEPFSGPAAGKGGKKKEEKLQR